MSEEYRKILDELSDIQETLQRIKIDKYLDRFKGTNFFDTFEDKFKTFVHDVENTVDDAKRAIESPIYVGVVGHYSHGKSSLLNAMLFPSKSKELLPTGDNIVTSMCTLLQFDAERNSNEFNQVDKFGEDTSISEEEYSAKVSGKRTGQIQDLHYFRLVLSTSALASNVFKSMAEKHIELLDTPGLGGPYWKDEVALQQWMREFMLLIVCVKADQINARTAAVINPFLKQTSRPIIPVVTFWDCWKKSPDYKGISDELMAREKAKENLARYFPAMTEAVDENRLIFVSAKNYREQVPLSEDLKGRVTEDWNIDNLRQSLSNYISAKISILQTQRSQESSLDKSRRETVLNSCRALQVRFSGLKPSLEKVIEEVRPKTEYDDELDEDINELQEKVQIEFERILDKLDNIIGDRTGSIPTNGAWSKAFAEIYEVCQQELKEQLGGDFRERVKRTLDRGVLRSLRRYIEESTPLEKNKQRRLLDNIAKCSDSFLDKITRGDNLQVFVSPQGVTDMAFNLFKEIFKAIKSLVITNLPLAVIVIVLSFCAPFVMGLLMKVIPMQVYLIFYAAVAVFILVLLSGRIKSAHEQTCSQIKEKARKQNRRADLKKRICPEIEKTVDEFRNNLREEMADALESVSDTSNEMLTEVQSIVRDTTESLRTIEKQCGEITRRVR